MNRFHFMGGSRFVHGGAMLQEIVVPVVTVRHKKDKGAGATIIKPVTVHVLGTSHKITTSRHRFEMIQMPGMDMEELFEGRRYFTEEQWIDVLLRSTGLEPTQFEDRAKWHFLSRMVPLVENNYNVCELGPRGTGKSHIYAQR